MAATYGKIGNNRLTTLAAKRESPSGSHLTSDSTRNCRLASGERPTIRVKSNVCPTGGRVIGAHADRKQSKNERRQNRRYYR